jgi:hypothetical protein
MKTQYLSLRVLAMLFMPLVFSCFAGPSLADPTDSPDPVPATAAEVAFIDRFIDQVEESVPPIDGWQRKLTVSISQYTLQDGKQVMLYESTRESPLTISIRVDFKTITDADRQSAREEKSAEALYEEMMAAAKSGDTEKMEQLQRQQMAMLQAQMEAGPAGQMAGLSPVTSQEKPIKFYVQIIVNGNGEHIGKKYDLEVPGVEKAFRIDKGKVDSLAYKYYLGAWEISDFDEVNWRIVDPAEYQTAANHLRVVTVYVIASGDRDNVESYVKNSLDLHGLKGMLD